MPWARIDDRANGDAKLLALSDAAYRMWVCGLIFCQFNLTDGFIPSDAIGSFGVRAKNKAALVQELTRSNLGKKPLWQPVTGGWHVNDFHDWNDSREDVLKKRQKGRDRIDRFRSKLNGPRRHVTNAVRNGSSNATCNALQHAKQTGYERRSFAASTTTTKDQNQEPREDAPCALLKTPTPTGQPGRMARMELQTIADVRRHLRAACHQLIETEPDCGPSDPFQLTNLTERLKGIAARDLHVHDYGGGAIDRIITAVVAARARRTA